MLGFPCDQFGHQEPGNEAEIAQLCSLSIAVLVAERSTLVTAWGRGFGAE